MRYAATLKITNGDNGTRNELAHKLLRAASDAGQVGMRTTKENRDKLEQLAQLLAAYSDPAPARIHLTGIHNLVYSAFEAGPPAGLVGPFVGQVSQVFHNETVYENIVRLGFLQVSIYARREILNDHEIQVSFYKTRVELFGRTVLTRPVELDAPGIWKQLFVGRVVVDDVPILLRVMHTPKLFILQQPLVESGS